MEEPEFKNLEHKTNLIKQAIKNNSLTSNILNDYLNDFKALPYDLRQQICSLDNTHLHHIYSDDDMECLWLEYKFG